MAHKIIVKVKDGVVTVEVDGVKGEKCTDLTARLEESLGTVTKRAQKPEYYITEFATIKQDTRF